MQVASLEEHRALEQKVDKLEKMIQQLTSSPLYLQWVTLDQACEILKIKTRETVIGMCRSGKIEYTKEGKNYKVNYPSIIAYKTKQTIK